MDNINIPHGISQTPTTSQSLRDKDSKETRTSREIDFSKWFGEHGSESIYSESIYSEQRAFRDRLIVNHTESTFCALNLDHQKPPLSQAVTCSQTEPDPSTMRMKHEEEWALLEKVLEGDYSEPSNLLLEEVLEGDYSEPSNLLDESDLPSPYSMASNLDHQKPPLSQAVTCSQTEPDPSTMRMKHEEEWALLEKVLEGDYSEPSNLLDESDLPSPYSMASNLDHQKPSLSQAVTYTRQTEPDLSTVGHKEWAPVEPLLSTEGESTANRTFLKSGRRPKTREALNSLIFTLMNGNLNIPLPKDPNFSNMTTVYSYFNLWQKSRVLKSVLALLEEKAQEPLKSHYRSLLKNFQEASNCQANPASLESLRLKFDEIVKFSFQGVTDEQWLLIEPLLVKKEKLEHWSIGDQEWALVESLLSTKVEKIRNQRPRKALNSLLFVLMSGEPNILLPKDPNFSCKATVYEYFNLWRQDRVLERVLGLLEEEAQEPLKSHYRSLVKNFQEASNCQANRASLYSLRLKFDEIVELSFQGVTDKQWTLIQPLLSKADHRPALNLIFSLLITEASSFASSSLTETNEAAEYLALWKKDGTLEKVLIQLIEVTQERVQSGYLKMLNHLTAQPIPQLQPQPTSNEECDLMTDDQSDLDHQGSSPRPSGEKRREDDPKLWRISDREWNMVEPLFSKEVKKTKGNPRGALNSLLFILINGDSTHLPKNPNFSSKLTANEYFLVWQKDKALEEALPLLEKESQEPLQSHYRKLLENLQKISNSKTEPLSICKFKKKFGKAGSGFQGVTDGQWALIDPLLNKKITKSGRHHRRDLNSIFSVIINGVRSTEIPATSNFSGPTNFYRYFTAWTEDGTLKKVLTQLIKEAQGTPLQSDYQKALDRVLQEGSWYR